MKQKPSPAIHMEKQLGWACKLGVTESLGISKVCQTVLARLNESQIWHPLASSVVGMFRKWIMASAHLEATHFSFLLCTTGTFQAATLALELRGSESEYVSPCMGSLRGTAWGSRVSSTNSIPTGFCSQKLWGPIFLALGPWAGGPGVGLGLFAPDISVPKFCPLHMS